MITSRDIEVKEFLKEFKIADTTIISKLFFPSLSACQKRLKIMHDKKVVKRDRDFITREYIYYLKRPNQLKHAMLVSRFYAEMKKTLNIQTFKIEPKLGEIRPDALFGYEENGIKKIGLLEVEISNKGFNYYKYKQFLSNEEYKKYFPIVPRIHIVTNKKINQNEIKTKSILYDEKINKEIAVENIN